MSIFVSGALVLAKWHFTIVEKNAKSCIFKNCSFGWHESTSYRISLMLRAGPVGS